MTPAEVRALVPAVRERAYLNTATYGPASEPVVRAIAGFTDLWSRGEADFRTWEASGEDCRTLFATLLHAASDDVAIQPYVSTAAGALAVRLRGGDRVVVSEMEYTSNLWPWLYQRERGVEVVVVPAPTGRPRLEDFAAAIGGSVALVAVSAFQSSNGWRADLAVLSRLARGAGGMLFVDACQGAGALDLDPARDGFDILCADSYKWLMGPRGAGYMYISPAARDRYPPVTMGWRSGRDPHASYYGVEMDLSQTASRHDSSLAWLAVVGDRESLTLLNAVGAATIEAHDMALAARFRAGLERLDLEADGFAPGERSPIVALTLRDPEATVARLQAAGVTVARRAAGVRFSFHVFNDGSDVDRALEALG